MALDIESTEAAGNKSKTSPSACRRFASSCTRCVVGQDDTIDLLLTCALTGSHALLVGVPGLAKTLMVKALAATFDWKFARIQFTPDLMPSDITGYELLDRDGRARADSMVFRRGPVFANLVLADEINRAAPKTQSALLEAMAEQHVTVGGQTYPLEEPFLVVATQNPIEQEGTYPLPEAQLDRFMMEIRLDYPTPEQEEEIVTQTTGRATAAAGGGVRPRRRFLQLRDLVQAVPVPQSVAAFAVQLVPRQPARRSPVPARSSRTTSPGAPGRAARRTWCWPPRPGALLLGRTAPSIDDVASPGPADPAAPRDRQPSCWRRRRRSEDRSGRRQIDRGGANDDGPARRQ